MNWRRQEVPEPGEDWVGIRERSRTRLKVFAYLWTGLPELGPWTRRTQGISRGLI